MGEERSCQSGDESLVRIWREAGELKHQARLLRTRAAQAEAAAARGIVDQVGMDKGVVITGLDVESLRGLVNRFIEPHAR